MSGHMLLAWSVSFVASRLLAREWAELRVLLAQARNTQPRHGPRPTVLAKQLLISGEDHRFFGHGGIDIVAICRALWRRAAFKRREGASTIEMQIVRVVSGRYERTVSRKLREMALATLVSQEIPKHELPGLYLELGYYGWRMTGFRAACRQLSIAPKDLTQFETARLVARLKYPQPRVMPIKRDEQIERRAMHLLSLYNAHIVGTTYEGLQLGLQ